MKKPVMILSSLVLISASSVAYFVPHDGGPPPPDTTDRKVQGLGKSGLITPAQAELIKRARAAAAGHTMEANSTLADQAKETAPTQPGTQTAPTLGPDGKPLPPKAATPPPPPPPPLPKWRLEGTTMGGHGAPSAVFAVEGWGEILIHPGDKLNERTKILAVHRKQVTLLTDGKKLETVSPW